MDINGRSQMNLRRESDEEFEITGSVKTQEQLLSLMRRPEYRTDPQYREQVKQALQRGLAQGHEVRVASPKAADTTRQRTREQVMEAGRAMFKDPRYKTSPNYRAEVEDYIRENGAVYDDLNRDTQIHNYLANGERHEISVKSGEVSGPTTPSK